MLQLIFRARIPERLSIALQLRQIFGWMGCFPADRAAISARLATSSVGFLPEGIAGIFNGANMYALPSRSVIRSFATKSCFALYCVVFQQPFVTLVLVLSHTHLPHLLRFLAKGH